MGERSLEDELVAVDAQLAALKKERQDVLRANRTGRPIPEVTAYLARLERAIHELHEVRKRIVHFIEKAAEAEREAARALPRYAHGTETERRGVSEGEAVALIAHAAESGRNATLRRDAKNLLFWAERLGLRVTYGVHRGGNPGRPDFTWHVTVQVGSKNYHLRLDARRVLWQITPTPPAKGKNADVAPAAAPKPWAPPGA
jgi:hypothetical protein